MDLSARDIHEKQFHDSWRGYNQEEVDEFLDRLADVVDRLQRENAALNERITELDHAVATSRDTEEMLKKTLVTAQQAAEEAIASAKAKAESLIQEAEERTRQAHREADEKLQQADAEARRKGLEADREHTIRKREVDSSLEKLRRFESDLKRRLVSFLNEQQRSLDRLTEEDPPRYQAPRSLEWQDRQQESVEGRQGPEGATPSIGPRGKSARDDGTKEEEEPSPAADATQVSARWIPDFLASSQPEDEEGAERREEPSPGAQSVQGVGDDRNEHPSNRAEGAGGSWEEPGFVRDTDLGSLYGTREAEAVDDEDEDPGPQGSEGERETDTVNLAEEETAPARSRSSRLFWRGDS